MAGDPSVLDGLTRRQMEDLKVKLEQRLRSCTLCGGEHAMAYKVTNRTKVVSAILLCTPCFEKHRLPESRAEA